MKSDRRKLFEQLRREFPVFYYNGYSYNLKDSLLHIQYNFSFGDKYFFTPEHRIPISPEMSPELIKNSLIRKMIVNLGMAEMISYWKAACSPDVIVRAAAEEDMEPAFWIKLFRYGLGEFFYVNGIDPPDDLLTISCEGRALGDGGRLPETVGSRVLVPVGGGKDSAVTLETLKGAQQCVPFIMNPRGASLGTLAAAGYREQECVLSSRTIDPALLELNKQGYLNGHTPFSAVLAFTAVLAAALNACTEVALSNESSANEPTIPGTRINHQYSKSVEFENDFRHYIRHSIGTSIAYYSFLRPLNELQISGLFSGLHEHHRVFRSCNVGSKTDSWCGKCSKCLFTFIMLSPFIPYRELVDIYGKDLLRDFGLLPLLDQLSGHAEEKPFECVGTVGEVNIALRQLIRIIGEDELPVLLAHYRENHAGGHMPGENEFALAMNAFGTHNIPSQWGVSLLKKMLDEVRY